jgi:hypothetical protein
LSYDRLWVSSRGTTTCFTTGGFDVLSRGDNDLLFDGGWVSRIVRLSFDIAGEGVEDMDAS